MYPQIAASGSSPNTASSRASVRSLAPDDVMTSNHASQRSIVPSAAAKAISHRGFRSADHAVAANAAASATSKPTQATS